jgi:hypothetical protein
LLRQWIAIKDPYPICGRGWKTRAFWGITLILFNPLLSLLYYLFGIRLKSSSEKPKHIVATRITCMTLVILIIIALELPIGVPRAEPRQWTKADKTPDINEITFLQNSPGKFSMGGGTGWFGYHYFDPSRIAIITDNKHPLMTHVGHALAMHLKDIPSVHTVTFLPEGKLLKDERLMPTLLIKLRADRITEIPLPMGILLDVDVEVSINSSQHIVSRWTRLPLAAISVQSSLAEKFASFGVASPAAKYNRIAIKLLNDIGVSFGGFLYPWWQYETMPPIPEYMYGQGGFVPPLPFADTAVSPFLVGGDLLIHNMAFWKFTNGEDLQRLQSRLEQENWSTKKKSNDDLRMVRGNEQLRFETENGPLVAHYINAFSPVEVELALERLLGDPNVGTDTLLFFGSSFRASERKDLFEAYQVRLEDVAPASFSIALERALVYEHADEKVQAQAMLNIAQAYEQLLTSPQGGWEMNRLAERLGINLSNEPPVNLSVVQSCSVNDYVELGKDIIQRIPEGEVFRFHVISSEGDQNQFYTARLTDLMWPMTPTSGGIYGREPLKVLTVTGKTFDLGTSQLLNVCAKKDDLLAAVNMSINLSDVGFAILTVKTIGNGQLEWRLSLSD